MPDTYSCITKLVNDVGSVQFSATLMAAFKRLVGFDQASIIVFDSKLDRPFCLASVWSADSAHVVLNRYLTEYFPHCEVLQRLRALRSSERNVSIIRYCKTEIKNPKFRRELYDNLGIDYDLALFDQTEGMSFFLEMFRNADSKPFVDTDMERAREFWPLALACINKHARLLQVLPQNDPNIRLRLEVLAQTFRDCSLTPREAEICSYIVSGHSSLAISLNLHISLNTVATLRRRAYRKLNISSQSELFAVCLHHMAMFVRKQAVSCDAFRYQFGTTPSIETSAHTISA
jgi:DNA-binding CsgD family transcriptional regulator